MAPEYYIFTGGVVPDHVTHVLIDKALKFVRKLAFYRHPNIEEVICHDGVEKIEQEAFSRCPRLRRVIMPGVKEIEQYAFNECEALTYIEWDKLERIGKAAFQSCTSLSSVDLPSIRIVERFAFSSCTNLTNAKLGKDLESIGAGAFYNCTSLERIALPLKDVVVAADSIFQACKNFSHVDLVEGEILDGTVAAFLMEEWQNDMNEEIHAINRILPRTHGGNRGPFRAGEKAQAIRTWIRSLLHKYTHYKAEHRHYLGVAAATLQPALPNDILFKSVLPFVDLPTGTFEGES